jgi:hypothetical protein
LFGTLGSGVPQDFTLVNSTFVIETYYKVPNNADDFELMENFEREELIQEKDFDIITSEVSNDRELLFKADNIQIPRFEGNYRINFKVMDLEGFDLMCVNAEFELGPVIDAEFYEELLEGPENVNLTAEEQMFFIEERCGVLCA